MLRHIAEAFGPQDDTISLAPTGRASLRLAELAGLDGFTIHRWCTRPIEDQKTGYVEWLPRDPNEIPRPESGIVLIDESSMIGVDLWEMIKAAAAAVEASLIFVGDGFQLPPFGGGAFGVLTDEFPAGVRAEINEIIRQAGGNPIIRASLDLRCGERNALRQLPRSSWDASFAAALFEDGGGVICHRRETRRRICAEVRAELDFSGPTAPGEPLMIEQNCYDCVGSSGQGLFNGELVKFVRWISDPSPPIHVQARERSKTPNVKQNLRFCLGVVLSESGGGPVEDIGLMCVEEVDGLCRLDDHGLLKNKAIRWYFSDSGVAAQRVWASQPKPLRVIGTHDRDEKWTLGFNLLNSDNRPAFIRATPGYAMTCHKSQGSQWKRVLVAVENSIDLDIHKDRRWMYTAITRASEEVVLADIW